MLSGNGVILQPGQTPDTEVLCSPHLCSLIRQNLVFVGRRGRLELPEQKEVIYGSEFT